jgi:hypothetical protein
VGDVCSCLSTLGSVDCVDCVAVPRDAGRVHSGARGPFPRSTVLGDARPPGVASPRAAAVLGAAAPRSWTVRGVGDSRMHGGAAPQVRRAAAERLEEDRQRRALVRADHGRRCRP